jgi:hypothetical protein
VKLSSDNPLSSVLKEAIDCIGANEKPKNLILASDKLIEHINDYLDTGDYLGIHIRDGLMILRAISLHLFNDHSEMGPALKIISACLRIISLAEDTRDLLSKDEEDRFKADFRTVKFTALLSATVNHTEGRRFTVALETAELARSVASSEDEQRLIRNVISTINENSKWENSPVGNFVFGLIGFVMIIGVIWGCNAIL